MGLNVPKTFESALDYILNNFDGIRKILKKEKENDFANQAHISYGRWMRNNWVFWGENIEDLELFFWFLTLGIQHPDDMSDIILRSVYRKYNGKPINLLDQVRHYKDYWASWKDEKSGEDDDEDDDISPKWGDGWWN